MESGTDDDLPPSHQNRGVRGRITGNGRSSVGATPHATVLNEMEIQIHALEQQAYSAILRAFKAQSDAITWEKEGLITELRKELRVSDEEHRELLSTVNADGTIHRIREWRMGGGLQSSYFNSSQPVHDPTHSPTVSASFKRQRTSMSLGAPSPAMHSQVQPSAAGKLGVTAGSKSKKPKPGQRLMAVSSMKSLQYASTGPNGRTQVPNRSSGDPADAAALDSLVGRKVWTRWPEDNSFYEAVISEYKPLEGTHALVYDINTDKETMEWINLREIPAEDIRWDGEDPGISRQAGRSRPGHEVRKSVKTSSKVFEQNGIRCNGSSDIEILHTETLMKEVERVVSGHPDPREMEKIKKVLKEHEQSLIDVISRLADASDGESEGAEDRLSHGRSSEMKRWKSREYTESAWG